MPFFLDLKTFCARGGIARVEQFQTSSTPQLVSA